MTWQGKLFVAGAFAVGLLINLVIYGGEVSEWFGTLDAKEIRDWIGVLIGGLAALVAGANIFYLMKQVELARLQARDTFQIQLLRSVALAKAANDAARQLWDTVWMSDLGPTQHLRAGYPSDKWRILGDSLEKLEEASRKDIFRRSDEEIGHPGHISHASIQESFRYFKGQHGKHLDYVPPGAEQDRIISDLSILWLQCKDYALSVKGVTETYLSVAEETLRRYER